MNWHSYDPIAETYARVAEGPYFLRPADDLVSLLDLAPGSRVLDVGAGTGAVAALAAELIGPTGLVVGLDPSFEMVRGLGARCGACAVVGALPRLPHPDASFDAVAAAFVLTHVADYAGALAALLKTLRPHGRLAASAWAQSPASTPPSEMWQTAVREFMDPEDLRVALDQALPWDERFSDPLQFERAFAAAGLRQIEVRQPTYSIRMSTPAYIETRLLALPSRFMESVLPAAEWVRFKDEASRRVTAGFGATVGFDVRVNIVVGVKP